ncbi:MAG: PAS domain-containing protein [Myxococcaceae bacterium]|nr:PAS domain-containing protein [Myxococcaceae bacterium]
MLQALVEIQSKLIRGGAAQPLLDALLSLVLEFTLSECGFLCEVPPTQQAAPRFQPLATSPPTWMEQLRELALGKEGRAQEPLGSLVEAALATGRPVSAGPLTAPAGGPQAPGAPRLGSLWILPVRSGDELVGLMGLANRRDSQDTDLMSLLQPALTACASVLIGWRNEQQRRAQEEEHRLQRANLEQLKQALSSVEDGLWDWNLPTQELHVSRRWRELLGYTEGELEPTLTMWMGVCHPEDLPEVNRLIRAHLVGNIPHFEFAYRARKKNGGWAWILCRARVVARDGQGHPVRVMGTDLDMTAHKDSEERLGALIRAIPDLIFRMRSDGTFLDWNDGTREPTALPPEAFLGKKIQELPLPRTFAEKTVEHVQRVIREGNLSVYEYELEMPQGLQRYEARIVRSGTDEAVSIIRNVTERTLVEERQTQLLRAEKLASLGQLAAGIAHEINNPVSYVTSNLRTLDSYVSELRPLLELQREFLAGEDGEERIPSAELLGRLRVLWKHTDVDHLLMDMVEIIQESLTGTRRIKEIVQSLRSFAREDDDKPQVVDLNAELESTLRMVWNELKYKCEVRRDFGALPPVTCYPTQITQVFTNLLMNAAQAIEGHGEIRIRTWLQEHEVAVEISDTGKGMTEETLARIFTPFFTTKPRGQGTGLGLSISRDIITRNGGRIDVQSEPDRGSTFTVFLPTAGGRLPKLTE